MRRRWRDLDVADRVIVGCAVAITVAGIACFAVTIAIELAK